MSRILAVCLNPTFQRTVLLPGLDKGEVNRAENVRVDAAGKGIHVARVINQLGGDSVHLTHLGPGKDEFLGLCEADDLSIVWRESSSRIRTCITLLDRQEHSTTEIIEPTNPVEASTVSSIINAFKEELQGVEMVVLSGSKAPGYPVDLFADFCGIAAKEGVPILADYRGDELVGSLIHNPAVVKINLVEFCATFLKDIEVSEADDSAALSAVEAKLRELSSGPTDWVITRGAREIYCASRGEISTVTPETIVPVNTVGSGDSLAGGMAFALVSGASLVDAVTEGARCGGLNALQLKPGSID